MMRIFKSHSSNKIIQNYYKRAYDKHVLISYILTPFIKGVSLSHTNTAEALAMAQVFDDLGYAVDVVQFTYPKKIEYAKYDVIIGFGDPLIHSFHRTGNKNITTIYYGTGMHMCWQNHATLKRVEEVFHKKGRWLLISGRVVDKAWSVQTTLVDSIITLGNETVLNSYRQYFPRNIHQVPVTYYHALDPEEILPHKNFEQAQKHFLWFGGGGLIHKGLDLLLDVFVETPELHLHICGPIDKETGFKEVYHDELYHHENIHTYGFVRLESDVYNHIINTCAFSIFPSCSEGEPGSVINTMYCGLIPVVPDTAGLQIKNFGIRIEDLSVEQIKQAIVSCARMDVNEVKERSLHCAKDTAETHSIEAYASKLKEALTDILNIDTSQGV